MDTDNAQPWYRQFWPWFLILLPGSAVVASLYTVSLAFRSNDSLVIDAEGGVDVVTERHIAAERRANTLGLSATVAIDTLSGAVTTTVHNGEQIDRQQSLQLFFSHPTIAARDKTVALTAAMSTESGAPVWAGHLVNVPAGRWYLVLTSEPGAADSWRLNAIWTGENQLLLRPASGAAGDER